MYENTYGNGLAKRIKHFQTAQSDDKSQAIPTADIERARTLDTSLDRRETGQGHKEDEPHAQMMYVTLKTKNTWRQLSTSGLKPED